MALQTFKSQLKAKLKTLGVNNLSNERIDAYAATLHKKNPDLKDDDPAAHDTKIDELNEFIDFKKVATDDDRLRTAESKLKNPPAPAKAEDDEEEEDDDTPAPAKTEAEQPKKKKERIPAYAKAIMEELQALKNEKKTATITERIKGHEKIKDVPEDFYEEWVKPDKEEDIDSFAEKVATKYSTYKQIEKNDKAKNQTKPVSGSDPVKVDPKEVKSLVDDLMPQTRTQAKAS